MVLFFPFHNGTTDSSIIDVRSTSASPAGYKQLDSRDKEFAVKTTLRIVDYGTCSLASSRAHNNRKRFL